MKITKYELEKTKETSQGLQFIHDHFLSYLAKAGMDKFDKMLKENDEKKEKLLEKIIKENKE